MQHHTNHLSSYSFFSNDPQAGHEDMADSGDSRGDDEEGGMDYDIGTDSTHKAGNSSGRYGGNRGDGAAMSLSHSDPFSTSSYAGAGGGDCEEKHAQQLPQITLLGCHQPSMYFLAPYSNGTVTACR